MKFKQYILLERLDKVKARQMIQNLQINPSSITHNKTCKAIYIPETKDLFTFDCGKYFEVEHINILDELKELGMNFDFPSAITLTIDCTTKRNIIWVSSLKFQEKEKGFHNVRRCAVDSHSANEMKHRSQIIQQVPQIKDLIQNGYIVRP